MIPIVVATVVVAGVVGALGVGVVQFMRPRRMSIVDYPELPSPESMAARDARGGE